MGLFGPPNVEKMKAQRDVDGLIKTLGYRKDTNVCTLAAVALGQLYDARAIKPLISVVVEGSDTNVRNAACNALINICIKLGDIEPLVVLLKRKYNGLFVRKAAASALGQIGNARAINQLLVALYTITDKKLCPDEIYQVVIDALVKIGAPAVEPLIIVLRDSHWSFYHMAVANILGLICDARAIEPLIAALGDDNVDVRKAAAGALDKIGWLPPDGTKEGSTYWAVKNEPFVKRPSLAKREMMTPKGCDHDWHSGYGGGYLYKCWKCGETKHMNEFTREADLTHLRRGDPRDD
jgi:HEAT repeat protein